MRLGDADARAAAGRLDEQREAERRRPGARHAVGVAVPLARGHRDRRHHRQPGGLRARPSCRPCPCSTARGQDAGADVADARPSRASPGWCRPRPTARAAAGRPRRPRPASAAAATARARRGRCAPASRSQRDRGAVAVDAGQLVGALDPQPLGVAGLQHPAAVGGDPDRHHVVRRRGRSRRSTLPAVTQRDGVLAGAPAEDDRRRGACGLAGGGLVHRADPTGPSGLRRHDRPRPAATLEAPATTRRHRRPPAARARRSR